MSTPYENRRTWVAALRSGEFAQADGVLTRIYDEPIYDEDTHILSGMVERKQHCCLGVACHISKEELKLSVLPDLREHRVHYNNQEHYLPVEVREWLGLETYDGKFVVYSDKGEIKDSLANMNDNGASFAKIADMIDLIDNGGGHWFTAADDEN